MTSLNENFETSTLTGYRGGTTLQKHEDIRAMKQTGERRSIPTHYLTRFTIAELSGVALSDLKINVRSPGDNWTTSNGSIITRENVGLKPEIGFVCDAPNTSNVFTSIISRPKFAMPIEPLDYSIDISGYSDSAIIYLTVPELSSDIDLAQSFIMFSHLSNNTAWRMVPLSGTGITQSNRQIYFAKELLLSPYGSTPASGSTPAYIATENDKILSVRLSLRRISSSGTAPRLYVSEIGIRDAGSTWSPMKVNTRSSSLVRSSAKPGFGILGEIPTPSQTIWANEDNSRISVLGGTLVADFNTGNLPEESPGAIHFNGGDVAFQPVQNAATTHEMTSSFSIACWAKFDSASFASGRTMGIVSKYVEPFNETSGTYDSSHGSYRLGVTTAGEIVFQLAATTYTTTASGGATISPNTWYHIVVTREGTSLKIYVNSVLISTQTVSASVVTDSAPFSIGTWSRS